MADLPSFGGTRPHLLARPRGTDYFFTRARAPSRARVHLRRRVRHPGQAGRAAHRVTRALAARRPTWSCVSRQFDSQLLAVVARADLFWLGVVRRAPRGRGVARSHARDARRLRRRERADPRARSGRSTCRSFTAGRSSTVTAGTCCLCEAGFLAIFLAPAWRPRSLPRADPPPLAADRALSLAHASG